MTHSPRYSVIVPAYNAVDVLGACLRALLDQSVPQSQYEIIVVDDGSVDATARLARGFGIQVLQQSHSGPAAARNLGAKSARGRLLLFTDADCVPIRTWITAIAGPLEDDEGVAGAKGVYRTLQRGVIPRLAQVEFEEKYARLANAQSIDFVDTASAAFRRDAFWQAGGFDQCFEQASNEDTQLSFQLAALGWRLAFAPEAVVHHLHSESLRRYLQRKWRHGYWRVRVYRRHPGKIAGDSYTPRSLQLQFAAAWLTLLLGLLPGARRAALLMLVTFVAGVVPFVRRAGQVAPALAAVMPFILYLRAMALGLGLASGVGAFAIEALQRWLARRIASRNEQLSPGQPGERSRTRPGK
jgi:cellulose synthase/poly-beta-1,6-N-acetylglucosamine synthase-like glycosyltransferase